MSRAPSRKMNPAVRPPTIAVAMRAHGFPTAEFAAMIRGSGVSVTSAALASR